MKKDFLIFLCALSALFFIPITVKANTVTVPSDPAVTISTTTYLPIGINAGSSAQSAGCYSVSQQLYYASELTGASSNTINAITFYYNEGTTLTRKLRVWISNTSLEDFPTPGSTNTPNFVNPGTKVFSGDVNLKEPNPYTITFNTPFVWDGTSNIIITVFDSTGLFNSYADIGSTAYTPRTQMFETAGKVRFLHKISRDKDFANAGWTMDNLTAATAYSITPANRKYANRITFTFAAAAVVPATPSDLAVSSVDASSATLAWSAVEGATSYDLQQSADGESWSTLSSGETGTSFNWTGLSAASTQFARIRATNAVGPSDWSSAVTVTTDAPHIHNGISFSKWASNSTFPTSGNFYLNSDIAFGWENLDVTLTGNLNLCLNGHVADLFFRRIIIPSGVTFTLFDNVGGGKITSFFAGSTGEMISEGLITVNNGGTLILGEGAIENTYVTDEDGVSIAICSQGTLKLSGAPSISSNDIDIYLGNNSNITIESGKPLTNSTPFKVSRLLSGKFTSGWTNMSGADPSDHFVSAKAGHGIGLSESEAAFLAVLALDENSGSNESTLLPEVGQTHNVAITRSTLTSSQFNTFCLPFALSNAQLEEIFGAGYDLEEFVSSEIVGEELVLTFNQVDALVAGKPYLIQPSINVTNPSFEGVTISAAAPVDQEDDTYISFHGVFNPIELTGGNKNLLFLGANNELFWPASTGNLKGFRAYFEVKGAAQKAKAARIVKKEDQSQAIENVENPDRAQKRIVNGQLIIEKNGRFYNAQGQIVK